MLSAMESMQLIWVTLSESVIKKCWEHTILIPRTTASSQIVEDDVIHDILYAIEWLVSPLDRNGLPFILNPVNENAVVE